jgi:hypothetical protein
MRFALALAAASALLGLGGCGWLADLRTAPGTVGGRVLYAGEPANGRKVYLTGAGLETGLETVTAPDGSYVFTGVKGSGLATVEYRQMIDADPALVKPNEVAAWRSRPFTLGAGGKAVPDFDVAYNGLIYPEPNTALIVNEESPVPFHWHVQPSARRYRVRLTPASAGGAAADPVFVSPWSGTPTAVFQASVSPGNYTWEVELDGGDAGYGVSAGRVVAL